METFKWILNKDLIKDLIIHTTIPSLRRAIDSSVYKKRLDDQFVRWELKDEDNSPLLTHVYIVDYLKYLSYGLNEHFGDYYPTEEPTEIPTEEPTQVPFPIGYLTWDDKKTGLDPKKELTCTIDGTMAIFDGNVAYYNSFYEGPGNYVGVTYHLNGNPLDYPKCRLVITRSHSSEQVVIDNPFRYDINGDPIVTLYLRVNEPGEEIRTLLEFNGVDGGPDDPYTVSIIVAISQESNLLTQ